MEGDDTSKWSVFHFLHELTTRWQSLKVSDKQQIADVELFCGGGI